MTEAEFWASTPAEVMARVKAVERIHRRWSMHTAWRVQQFDREGKHFKPLDVYLDEGIRRPVEVKRPQTDDEKFEAFARLAGIDLKAERAKRAAARAAKAAEAEGSGDG